jgi:hypothetical protein
MEGVSMTYTQNLGEVNVFFPKFFEKNLQTASQPRRVNIEPQKFGGRASFFIFLRPALVKQVLYPTLTSENIMIFLRCTVK